jgi:hypothetical protein
LNVEALQVLGIQPVCRHPGEQGERLQAGQPLVLVFLSSGLWEIIQELNVRV